jgi:hypothetical protein
LAREVSQAILRTFDYYYVAIFTLESKTNTSFSAPARAVKNRTSRPLNCRQARK